MKFLLLFSLLFSPQIFARGGGWVSSGGELFKDAHNPWFLRNTQEVFYCIQIDKTSISASEQVITKQVKASIDYWKKEFKRAGTSASAIGSFSLGQQVFTQKDCSHTSLDLKFKFGFGTLTKDEIKFLENPENKNEVNQYIGVSVRTNYEKVTLKGEGFIYIASDMGPHAYENEGNLVDKAWREPKLLSFALIHELGHVFGIAHSGNGVMSEVFLDQLLSKFLVQSFLRVPMETFLSPGKELIACNVEGKVKRLVFKMEAKENCIKLIQDSSLNKYEIFAMEQVDSSTARKIGELLGLSPELWDNQSLPISVLQLTKDQNVFTPNETGFRNFMFGPLKHSQGYKGTLFINATSKAASVYIKVQSNSVAIYGNVQRDVKPLVLIQSPLSLLLLKEPTP